MWWEVGGYYKAMEAPVQGLHSIVLQRLLQKSMTQENWADHIQVSVILLPAR